MSGCVKCARLEVRLADMEADRDAWRARVEEEAAELADLTRQAKWREALKAPPRAVVLLMWMADRPGRVMRSEIAWRLTRGAIGALIAPDHDRAARVTVSVAVLAARNALRAAGLGEGVETVPGAGWRMDAASARALKAHVGEGAHAA